MIRIKEVNASRGKAMRAEPISLLYEKGRVLHRRGLDQLEAEMMAAPPDRAVVLSCSWHTDFENVGEQLPTRRQPAKAQPDGRVGT